MNIRRLKSDGFLISKKIFTRNEIEDLERSLVLFASLYIKKFSPRIFKKGLRILKKNNSNFKTDSLFFFDMIEKYDKDIFYQICKNIFRVEIINTFFKKPKINSFLKKYFDKSYLVIQKVNPFLVFNSKTTKRLKFEWHQERHFYSQKKGVHLWFPIFRDVTSLNDGSLKVAQKSNKKIYGYTAKKNKNGYLQKIPKINVDKNFKVKSLNLKRGDAVIFEHNTFHKSDDQNNSKPRIGIVVKLVN